MCIYTNKIKKILCISYCILMIAYTILNITSSVIFWNTFCNNTNSIDNEQVFSFNLIYSVLCLYYILMIALYDNLKAIWFILFYNNVLKLTVILLGMLTFENVFIKYWLGAETSLLIYSLILNCIIGYYSTQIYCKKNRERQVIPV